MRRGGRAFIPPSNQFFVIGGLSVCLKAHCYALRDGYGYTAAYEDEDSDASLDDDEYKDKDEDEDGDADGQAETRGTCLLALDNTGTGQPGTVKSK